MALKDALKRKKPISEEYFVPEDEAQAAKLQAAEQKLALARFAGEDEDVAKAEEKLEAVRAEVRETGVSFLVTSVGRRRFDELILENPPTADQKADPDFEGTFDPATFWPAILAESVEGGLTPEEWTSDFLDAPNWGSAEVKALKDVVFQVHTTTRVAELGN